MTRPIAFLTALLCLAAMLLAAGCDRTPAVSQEEPPAESFTALPGIDIASLIPPAQIAAGLGIAEASLAEPIVYEDGVAVRYHDNDYTVSLDISLHPLSAELLAQTRSACAAFTPAANLGDEAWYDEETGILYVFIDHYLLNVILDSEEISDGTRLSVLRHFAALTLDALP